MARKASLRLLCRSGMLLFGCLLWLMPLDASASTSGAAGGGGGARFDKSCRRGEVMVGVYGIAGSWMNRVGVKCVRVAGGKWAGQVANRGKTGGGGDMLTKNFSKSCPRDQAVAGFKGRAGQYLHTVQLQCRALSAGPKVAGGGTFAAAVGGSGGNAFGAKKCPNNLPASGIYGKSGIYVDRLGLKCGDESVWRPAFHYAPRGGWMNDPAGMVYLDGTWHLSYQHVRAKTAMDPAKMTWGHATSRDLVHWSQSGNGKDKLFGLHKQKVGPATVAEWVPFTGSALTVPKGRCNCPGGGPTRCIAAVFTHHQHLGVTPFKQRQVMAPSCDGGKTYGRIRSVLDDSPYPAEPHARDPKIARFGNKYVMVLAAGDKVKFYSSTNLSKWRFESSLLMYKTSNIAGPFVETPDLFELPVENAKGESRWVLTFAEGFLPPSVCKTIPLFTEAEKFCEKNMLDNHSSSLYLVGAFGPGAGSKLTFTPERKAAARGLRFSANRMDGGPDFYAPQTFDSAPKAARSKKDSRSKKQAASAAAKSKAAAQASAKAKARAKKAVLSRDVEDSGPADDDWTVVERGIDVFAQEGEAELEDTTSETAEVDEDAVVEPATDDEGAIIEEDLDVLVQDDEIDQDLEGETVLEELPLSEEEWLELTGGAEETTEEDDAEVVARGVGARDRRVVMGWQSNWRYAHRLPTTTWRGQQSIPRELGLRKAGSRHVLLQRPVIEIDRARGARKSGMLKKLTGASVIKGFRSRAYDGEVVFEVGSASEVGLHIRADKTGQTKVGWRRKKGTEGELFLDRTSGWGAGGDPPGGFSGRWTAPAELDGDGRLTLRVLVDRGSVEVFASDGGATVSGLIYPDPAASLLRVYSVGSAGSVRWALYGLPK